MPSKRDYYEILGLPRTATAEQIKDAYRKLAMEFHPDRNKAAGAEDKFKEVSEAYAALSDAEKRKTYDQFGHSGFDQRYSQEDIFRNANFQDIFRDFGFEGGSGSFGGGQAFSGMFGDLFGFNQRPQSGESLTTSVQITLADVAHGVEKVIPVSRLSPCESCHGTGSSDGKFHTCSQCRGNGVIQRTGRMGPFSVQQTVECPQCHGSGQSASKPCKACQGQSRVRVSEKVKVRIPEGIEDGQTLRVEGKGNSASNPQLPPGDLLVSISVEPHPQFRREGPDLLHETLLSFSTAALGGTLEVPTLYGTAQLKIPPGTQSHTLFRLKHKGLPDLETSHVGDQLVRVLVHTPEKLSKRQRELLEEFQKDESLPAHDGKGKRGFFDGMFG